MKQPQDQRAEQKLLQMLSAKTGKSVSQLEQQAARGDLAGLTSGLDPATRATVNKLIADPQAAKKKGQLPPGAGPASETAGGKIRR